MRDLNADLKAQKVFQFSFCLQVDDKNNREIIRENAFEHKKKKSGLILTPG